jgi:hypothetical protein
MKQFKNPKLAGLRKNLVKSQSLETALFDLTRKPKLLNKTQHEGGALKINGKIGSS